MPEESLHHTCKTQYNFIVTFVCSLFKEVAIGKVLENNPVKNWLLRIGLTFCLSAG